MRKYRRILMIPLVLLLVAVVLFFTLRIQEVTVEGSEIYSQEQVIQHGMSGQFADHTIYFWLMNRLKGVPCLPFTQEIDVEWHGFNKITLHVYDKKISGCVKYMGQYVFFDKDGIVLQSLSSPMEGVPIVTGIEFGKFTMNQAFDVEDDSLFETIMDLSLLIDHYDVQVDQIRFQEKKVTLYSGKVQVFLGEKQFYDDDLAALSSVLQKTNEEGMGGTINMEHFEPGDKIVLDTNTNGKKQNDNSSEPEQ